jgi:hypothetical protein
MWKASNDFNLRYLAQYSGYLNIHFVSPLPPMSESNFQIARRFVKVMYQELSGDIAGGNGISLSIKS